ncbi:MAG: glycosyltransferase, partial [Candidatus Saccharimonadales bacterium]
MNFLFATTAGPRFGGPHSQVLRLTRPLADRGWQTTALMPLEPDNPAERLRSAGVDVVELPLHRLQARPNPVKHLEYLVSLPGEVRRIRRLLAAKLIDLVVVAGHFNPQAAIAARLQGLPVVWQIIDTYPPMLHRRLFMPMVTRLSDSLMSTGVKVAHEHPGAEQFGARLVPFFFPVDAAFFKPMTREQRMAARKELGLEADDCVIGTVGNISTMKGHGLFITAALTLRRTHPETRFVILGSSVGADSSYAEGLWRRAESNGLRLGRDLIVRDPGIEVARF